MMVIPTASPDPAQQHAVLLQEAYTSLAAHTSTLTVATGDGARLCLNLELLLFHSPLLRLLVSSLPPLAPPLLLLPQVTSSCLLSLQSLLGSGGSTTGSLQEVQGAAHLLGIPLLGLAGGSPVLPASSPLGATVITDTGPRGATVLPAAVFQEVIGSISPKKEPSLEDPVLEAPVVKETAALNTTYTTSASAARSASLAQEVARKRSLPEAGEDLLARKRRLLDTALQGLGPHPASPRPLLQPSLSGVTLKPAHASKTAAVPRIIGTKAPMAPPAAVAPKLLASTSPPAPRTPAAPGSPAAPLTAATSAAPRAPATSAAPATSTAPRIPATPAAPRTPATSAAPRTPATPAPRPVAPQNVGTSSPAAPAPVGRPKPDFAPKLAPIDKGFPITSTVSPVPQAGSTSTAPLQGILKPSTPRNNKVPPTPPTRTESLTASAFKMPLPASSAPAPLPPQGTSASLGRTPTTPRTPRPAGSPSDPSCNYSLQCEVCQKEETTLIQLQTHYSKHFTKELAKHIDLMTEGNKCNLCGQMFKSRPALTEHIGCKHGKINDVLIQKGLKVLPCPVNPRLQDEFQRKLLSVKKEKLEASGHGVVPMMSPTVQSVVTSTAPTVQQNDLDRILAKYSRPTHGL